MLAWPPRLHAQHVSTDTGAAAEPPHPASVIPIPKGSAQPASCADLRGLAVSTLAATVYAAVLECRASNFEEVEGSRAEGQFSFRRRCGLPGPLGMSLAAFGLQEQVRFRGVQLWACFVDFKQAYDRVRRDSLWAKLEARA